MCAFALKEHPEYTMEFCGCLFIGKLLSPSYSCRCSEKEHPQKGKRRGNKNNNIKVINMKSILGEEAMVEVGR